MNRNSYAPLILAIVLLFLPVLYVGSYFALVVPEGIVYQLIDRQGQAAFKIEHYRYCGVFGQRAYWPLEQLDRAARPARWEIGQETSG